MIIITIIKLLQQTTVGERWDAKAEHVAVDVAEDVAAEVPPEAAGVQVLSLHLWCEMKINNTI